MSVSAERAAELVDLDEALKRLDAVDARRSRVVELRYFGGLSVEGIAEVLAVSSATVRRDWTAARA
jgi:RNA polymerase sigma factor (sigma-70 family)